MNQPLKTTSVYETFRGITPELRSAILEEIQEGKIFYITWKKKSLLGAGIRFVERFKHNFKLKKNWEVDKSHASLLIGIFTPLQQIVDRLIHLEAIGRGITPNSLSWSLNQKDVEYIDIYELRLPDNSDTQKVMESINQAYSLAWESVNKPYGFTTILSIAFTAGLIALFGESRVIAFGVKTGLDYWLRDKLNKNNICSQLTTLVANLQSKIITGEKFTEKPTWAVDPEAFENTKDKLVLRYRVYKNV